MSSIWKLAEIENVVVRIAWWLGAIYWVTTSAIVLRGFILRYRLLLSSQDVPSDFRWVANSPACETYMHCMHSLVTGEFVRKEMSMLDSSIFEICNARRVYCVQRCFNKRVHQRSSGSNSRWTRRPLKRCADENFVELFFTARICLRIKHVRIYLVERLPICYTWTWQFEVTTEQFFLCWPKSVALGFPKPKSSTYLAHRSYEMFL